MKEKTNNKLNKKMIIAGAAMLLVVIIVFMILFFNKKEEFTIVFDSNGGSQIASIIVNENDVIQKPKDPVREGYVFAGWYYNDELYDFSKPVTCDMTLVAQWVVAVDADVEENKNNDDLTQQDTPKVDDKKNNGKVENNKVENNKDNNKEEQPKEEINIAVTGVTLDKTSLTLTEGEGSKLSATVNPTNATNKNVTWSSNNTAVVTVDANGNVTAIKPGTATITVTTTDGNYTATCIVTVNEKPANYVVTFTPEVLYEDGATLQYSVVVTRDGNVCDYKFIIYNGEKLGKYPDAGDLATKLSTATIRLTDGTDVTASVVFK